MTLVIFGCFLTARTILITVGASNRFLEDLSPDIPRECFFGKSLLYPALVTGKNQAPTLCGEVYEVLLESSWPQDERQMDRFPEFRP